MLTRGSYVLISVHIRNNAAWCAPLTQSGGKTTGLTQIYGGIISGDIYGYAD